MESEILTSLTFVLVYLNTVYKDSRSPFEFLGRTFDGGQHSAANILYI